ncbi:MAG: 3' terminal RNA ribose 2'-O-methyltransferase Hen1 [Micrococcales bacterium]|nr:3' terminal RNA ribose 2'-O-methyltransferase Hen1 [Micrococcales bacterium]
MLLTVTTTHRPATDLGYLLFKHPDRVQEFRRSFGTVTVFYPEATDERCTVAVLLEIDPIRLARSVGRGAPDFSLAQYVNDRSYAASSLLGVAVADVFSTARSGRGDDHQALADTPIPLEIAIPVLPCRGGPQIARRVFEPLGWQVEADPIALDDRFDEWGDSRYVRLRLTGTVRLADALNQLHVLLPVMDESKHYWQGNDEVDKLLRSGEGWLVTHPDAELITRRYLGRRSGLTRHALERLAELSDEVAETFEPTDDEEATPPAVGSTGGQDPRFDVVLEAAGKPMIKLVREIVELTDLPLRVVKEQVNCTPSRIVGNVSQVTAERVKEALERCGASVALLERPVSDEARLGSDPSSPDGGELVQPVSIRTDSPDLPLNVQRHRAVLAALLELGARSVVDLGCGSGQFLAMLMAERRWVALPTGGQTKAPWFTRVVGTDVSTRSLQVAARRLRLDRLGERQAERIELLQGALTYTDTRLAGFDAAVLMEVIEHVDPERLPALERVVFGAAHPGAVLVTTPNSEYNPNYEGLTGMRHPDHRFEWTREEFRAWAERVAAEYGYTVELRGIGDLDPDRGTPTQMAVFRHE